eukprot:scaffold105399_cov31-Tisochrysis_lutea.AAC.1
MMRTHVPTTTVLARVADERGRSSPEGLGGYPYSGTCRRARGGRTPCCSHETGAGGPRGLGAQQRTRGALAADDEKSPRGERRPAQTRRGKRGLAAARRSSARRAYAASAAAANSRSGCTLRASSRGSSTLQTVADSPSSAATTCRADWAVPARWAETTRAASARQRLDAARASTSQSAARPNPGRPKSEPSRRADAIAAMARNAAASAESRVARRQFCFISSVANSSYILQVESGVPV